MKRGTSYTVWDFVYMLCKKINRKSHFVHMLFRFDYKEWKRNYDLYLGNCIRRTEYY